MSTQCGSFKYVFHVLNPDYPAPNTSCADRSSETFWLVETIASRVGVPGREGGELWEEVWYAQSASGSGLLASVDFSDRSIGRFWPAWSHGSRVSTIGHFELHSWTLRALCLSRRCAAFLSASSSRWSRTRWCWASPQNRPSEPAAKFWRRSSPSSAPLAGRTLPRAVGGWHLIVLQLTLSCEVTSAVCASRPYFFLLPRGL